MRLPNTKYYFLGYNCKVKDSTHDSRRDDAEDGDNAVADEASPDARRARRGNPFDAGNDENVDTRQGNLNFLSEILKKIN